MIKTTKKLKNIPVPSAARQAVTGTVAVNTTKTVYKNTKILTATANIAVNASAGTSASKTIVKATDVKKDAVRIENGTVKSTVTTPPAQPASNPKYIPPEKASSQKDIPHLFDATNISPSKEAEKPNSQSDTTDKSLIQIVRENASESKFIPFLPIGDAAPSAPVTASIQETVTPTAGVFVSSSIVASELSIFGANSLFMLPINPEMAEKTTGLELKKWEKPRVIAVIAENVRNGYPSSNAVAFKKLTSNRASVSKYIIYRKAVFKNREFQKVAELTADQAVLPQKYVTVINDLGYNIKDTFVFIDNYIPINATYVYKVEVEWIATGVEPSENFDFTPYLGYRLDSGLIANQFLSGAI